MIPHAKVFKETNKSNILFTNEPWRFHVKFTIVVARKYYSVNKFEVMKRVEHLQPFINIISRTKLLNKIKTKKMISEGNS